MAKEVLSNPLYHAPLVADTEALLAPPKFATLERSGESPRTQPAAIPIPPSFGFRSRCACS